MKSRTPSRFHGRPCLIRSASEIDALKELAHLQHAALKPGLFLQLARRSFHQRLTKFQRSSRNRPLPFQWLGCSSDLPYPLVLNPHSPHSYNLAPRTFPPRTHSSPRFRFSATPL